MSLEPVRPPSGFARFGRTGAVLALIALAAIAVVGGASYLGDRVGGIIGTGDAEDGAPVEPGLDVEIVVPAGASAQDIAAILAAQGVVESAAGFERAVRTAGAASALRAGTYQLVTGMEPQEVVTALRAGPISDATRITIREGLRVSEILAQFAEDTGRDVSEFENALLEGEVTTSLRDMPDDVELFHWEGLLFPDTYEFDRSASAASMLQRLASTMEQRVSAVDWSAAEEAGLDVYEGIIVASLVESEVRVADERPLVSSVIYNRLEEGMVLGIDATVLYAQETRSPDEIDVDVDSPYNTRQNPGLPPTPISAPGMAALEAAAHPQDTEFLYYVLSSPDGAHTFTTNIDDHNAAVRQAREDGIIP